MPATLLRPLSPALHHALLARYVEAPRDHVGDPGLGTGDHAQGTGRAALAAGCAISDLEAMHEQVLATLLGIVRLRAVERDGDGAGRIFFAQALMPVKAER